MYRGSITILEELDQWSFVTHCRGCDSAVCPLYHHHIEIYTQLLSDVVLDRIKSREPVTEPWRALMYSVIHLSLAVLRYL